MKAVWGAATLGIALLLGLAACTGEGPEAGPEAMGPTQEPLTGVEMDLRFHRRSR